MTKIILLRHANAYDMDGNQEPDTPLRFGGEDHAEKLATRLLDFGIEKVYASPYTRAFQTATAFANKSNLEIEVNEKLKEIGTEEWTENDFNKAKELTEDIILSIVSKNKDKIIAVFTHGNFIKTLLCQILSSPLSSYKTRLEIGLASITCLKFDEKGGLIITGVSDNSHILQNNNG